MKKKTNDLAASVKENLGSTWQHPELKDNEVLLINVRDDEDWESKLPDWVVSVRRGKVAYTTGGKKKVKDMKPLFGVLSNYKLEAGAGDYFPRVVERAKEINVLHNRIVEFDFNGVKCLVGKNTNPEWLFRDFQNAHTMDWKVVGPDCLEAYESEVQAELEKRNDAAEKQLEAQRVAWKIKDDEQRRLADEKVKSIEIEFSDKEGYDKWKAVNSGDGYGLAAFEFAEYWAKLMQKTFKENNIENPDVTMMIAHADKCANEVSFLGITGFQFGAAVSILSHCWKYGKSLEMWHKRNR